MRTLSFPTKDQLQRCAVVMLLKKLVAAVENLKP